MFSLITQITGRLSAQLMTLKMQPILENDTRFLKDLSQSLCFSDCILLERTSYVR